MNVVADAIGVSKSIIQNLEDENNDREPSYIVIRNLVKHYGVSAKYLLGLTDDYHDKPSAVDELGLSPEAVEKIKQQIGTTGFTIADFLNIILGPSDDLSDEDKAAGLTCIFDKLIEPLAAYIQILTGEVLAIKGQKPDIEDIQLRIDADNLEKSIQPFFEGKTEAPIYVIRHFWKLRIDELGKDMLTNAASDLAIDKAEMLAADYMEGKTDGNHHKD